MALNKPSDRFRKILKMPVHDDHLAVISSQLSDQLVAQFFHIESFQDVQIQVVVIGGISPEKIKAGPAVKHGFVWGGLF